MAYNFTDKNGLLYVITKIKNLLSNYLDKAGDSKDNTVTFTSGDSTNPTGWADINLVASGETHASLFRKFSLAVKNLRYLYKMLGRTDISSISDGTATGAIATINEYLAKFGIPNLDNATFRYNEKDGKFELLYKGGETYSLIGWNNNSFSYDYFNGTEWVRKWDINSDLAVRNLKTYTSYDQINASANNTIEEVMALLPTNSLLQAGVAKVSNNLYNSLPKKGAGVLEFVKGNNSNRGYVRWTTEYGECYKAGYSSGLQTWERVALNSDLANYLPLTGGELTGSIQIASNSAQDRSVQARNSLACGSLMANSSGVFGIYCDNFNKWLLAANNDGIAGYVYGGSKTLLHTDNEGGNLEIISPNGQRWEIDAFENKYLRLFTYGSDTNGNSVKGFLFYENGNFKSDGEIQDGYGNKLNDIIPNAFTRQLICQTNVNLLDGSLPLNETRFVGLTSAVNSPVNTGMGLHKIENTDGTYFTNIATLIHLDTGRVYRNRYHSATGQWEGWRDEYALASDLNNLKFKIFSGQFPESKSAFYTGRFSSSPETGYIISAMCSIDKSLWVNYAGLPNISFVVNASSNGMGQVRGDIANEDYFGKWYKVIVAYTD